MGLTCQSAELQALAQSYRCASTCNVAREKARMENELILEIDGEAAVIEIDKLDRSVLIEGLKRGLAEMIDERIEEARQSLVAKVIAGLYA